MSTNDRVYGSHVLVVSLLLEDRTSAVELGLGGTHDNVAALEAAGGGRLRSVVAILPEPALCSFGFDLSVFNIPPLFFSGLGVLARGEPGSGGARFDESVDCKLFDRVASSPKLLALLYEGRGGGAGRLSGGGVGRGISA